MSADWLVQEHNEADKDTNATYRIGVSEGLRRAKLIPKPGIGAEIAHQVAMTAAEAAARVQQFPSDSIGKEVAQAYLQAYEAVEGWVRPPVPTVDTDADKASQFAPRYEMSTADPLHPYHLSLKSLQRADYFTNQATTKAHDGR